MEPDAGLRITLLGKFQIFWAGQSFDGIHARKQQELLSYLLVHRDRPHPRETLAAVFWGDYPTERSRKYLRQALWQLQSSLNQICPAAPEILLVEDRWVQFNPHVNCQLDIAEFELACKVCRAISPSTSPVDRVEVLKQAAALYQGDLLEGWYSDWCLFERERLQNEYVGLLEKIISFCDRQQDCIQGLEYAQKALQIDPFAEWIHYQMMRFYSYSDRRVEALRQYKRCEQLMRDEMHAAPSAQMQAFYQQLSRGDSAPDGGVERAGEPAVVSQPADERIQSVLALFNQLRVTLDQLQNQLIDELREGKRRAKKE